MKIKHDVIADAHNPSSKAQARTIYSSQEFLMTEHSAAIVADRTPEGLLLCSLIFVPSLTYDLPSLGTVF